MHDVLVEVDGVEVAIVVQKKLGEHLGIGAEGAEGLEDEDFLFKGGVGGFEDAEEDVRDEDFYF